MVGCHLPRSSKERIHWKQLTYSSARLLSTRRNIHVDLAAYNDQNPLLRRRALTVVPRVGVEDA